MKLQPVKPETALPQFAPFPYFLFDVEVNGKPLSYLAMIVYSLLRNRANSSQENGFFDENHNVYVFYPVKELSEQVKRDRGRIQDALEMLESAGLIRRERGGYQSASRIYIFQVSDDAKTPHLRCCENTTSDEVKTPHLMGRKRHINNNIEKEDRIRSTHAPVKHRYGEFKNVLLTDEEYQKLGEQFPDRDSRINDLSLYIGSKGVRYKSHYLTILRWARNEAKKNPARPAEKELPIF